MPRAIHTSRGAAETEQFFDSLYDEAKSASAAEGVMDSVGSSKVSKGIAGRLSQEKLPASVQSVLANVPESMVDRVLDSVLHGCRVYEAEHGCLPTGDVLEAALSQGANAALPLSKQGVLDNVSSSAHHDPISVQPNRAIVAVTAGIAEAIPFATYLPTDIISNEAKLIIVSHQSGSDFGGYAEGEIMDGVNIGKQFFSSERRITLGLNTDRNGAVGKISTAIGSTAAVQLLRGRTLVYINGFPAAAEQPNVQAGLTQSPIGGGISLNGTTHTISGHVVSAAGDVVLAFNPALPENTLVEVEGFIDFERQPELAPELNSQAVGYSLFASAWRGITRQTIDSQTQHRNEIGLDMLADNIMAVRNQAAMERHYSVLNKAMSLARGNTHPFDFKYQAQIGEKSSAMMAQELRPILSLADQQMAEDTMDHGITHIYVAKLLASRILTLGPEYFEPSGLVARPGVYRLGRLFGRYEVYYSPNVLSEQATTSQILCVGRSQQVARCPFVLGDAVAPTLIPLAVNGDLTYGQAFYARNFTAVNPHMPSARGAALINVTGLN